MKKLVFVGLLLMSTLAYAQAAPIVKNLGTTADTQASNQAAVQCQMFKGGVLQATTAAIVGASPASVRCQFNAVSLTDADSFTAAYVDSLGRVGPQNVPFVIPATPGKPSSALQAVP